MTDYFRSAASAAVLLSLSSFSAMAEGVHSEATVVMASLVPTSTSSVPEPEATTTKRTARTEKVRTRHGAGGPIKKQISSVSTACLKPALMQIVGNASRHFGSTAIITSGFRRSRSSYHGKCMAADVQIAGVSPGTLARYFRAQEGVGGVGTYGHTRSVHVDVAGRTYSWHHGRRKARYASI
jgi:hypothetical protein